VRRARGFTLIELAVALAVIGLLLGMLIVPLNAQIDQQRINDARKQLALINEALLGFAVANGRLPCPATPTTANTTVNAGTENCALSEGVVPWATLALPETDPWNWRFTYRVTAGFKNNPPVGMQAALSLADNGEITVRATSGGIDIATGVAAIVVAHGKNGLGAYQTDGVRMTTVGAGVDELENTNADIIFVSKLPEPTYDDQVLWLSTHVLKSRLIAANRLP